MNQIRIGFGYDIHSLTENRKLILGGVEIPFEKGLSGHSDADALIHAICDAFLGALNLGDIGKHFPDTDEKYKNADSKFFLGKTYELVKQKGFLLNNLDTTIVLEKPKLISYIPKMKEILATIMNVDQDIISIKATTSEKMGFVGKGEGIKVFASLLIIKE